MTKKSKKHEARTPVMAIMKCCGRSTHTGKCASYWHRRQREEVRKRVAGEKLFNKEILAAENKTAEAWERAQVIAAEAINHAHDLAKMTEAHAKLAGHHPNLSLAGDMSEDRPRTS